MIALNALRMTRAANLTYCFIRASKLRSIELTGYQISSYLNYWIYNNGLNMFLIYNKYFISLVCSLINFYFAGEFLIK